MTNAGARRMPLRGFSPRRASRLVERNAMAYRQTWLILLTGFFEPIFYLLGIGYGVGSLVGTIATGEGQPLRYAVFVAPALMASSAMNGAIYESTFNLFYKMKYAKLYDTVLATPLGAVDVALGEVGWALIRGSVYAVGFVVVMTALGLVISPWAVLAVPAAVLIGFAFGAVGIAITTWVRSWADFDLLQTILMPLFLFSATFYPLSSYPAPLQVVVELTPLYHGVHLVRSLTLGQLNPGCGVDVAYLALMGAAGLYIAGRRLEGLLLR